MQPQTEGTKTGTISRFPMVILLTGGWAFGMHDDPLSNPLHSGSIGLMGVSPRSDDDGSHRAVSGPGWPKAGPFSTEVCCTFETLSDLEVCKL